MGKCTFCGTVTDKEICEYCGQYISENVPSSQPDLDCDPMNEPEYLEEF